MPDAASKTFSHVCPPLGSRPGRVGFVQVGVSGGKASISLSTGDAPEMYGLEDVTSLDMRPADLRAIAEGMLRLADAYEATNPPPPKPPETNVTRLYPADPDWLGMMSLDDGPPTDE